MMGQLTQLELPFHALFAGGSKSSTAGTYTPILRSKSSRERKFHTLELSLLRTGANGFGSEKSSYLALLL